MDRLKGKVAFITGAARGQGRAHAIKLAEEGADIIAIDICSKVESNVAPPATEADLAETVRAVEAFDRRIIASTADVRDSEGLAAAVADGVAALGRLDIVCANAGVWNYGLVHELSDADWAEVLDIVLTGVWRTCKAAIPYMIEQAQGGSIVITSSGLGLKAAANLGHYTAAKHGTVGLMRSMAIELAPHSIRVNTVNPGSVNTALVQNQPTYSLFAPDLENPTAEDLPARMATLAMLPVPWVEPEDVSNAVLFLASEESRYITGTTLVIDAGNSLF